MGYHWFGYGYILIGFTNGFLIVISTHPKEMGQELFQAKTYRDVLKYIFSLTLSKAASAETTVYDLQDIDVIIDVEMESGSLHRLDWSSYSQLLCVAATKGEVFLYLRFPHLSSRGDSGGSS